MGLNSEIGNLCRFVGQTVTIFTSSGGVSGCGFTGVLMSANDCFVRLLTCIGSAPSCPVGSNCCPEYACQSGQYSCGCGDYKNAPYSYGSICVIPVDQIVSFCHNAI